eukprot:UN34559
MISVTDAKKIKIVKYDAKTEAQGIDKALLQTFMKGANLECAELEKVLKIYISKGATVKNSNILHCIAANLKNPKLVGMVMKYAKSKQTINHPDNNGMTPIMIAAAATPGTKTIYKPPNMSMIEEFIKQGADLNLKSKKGLTP